MIYIVHISFLILIVAFIIYKALTKKSDRFKKFDKKYYFINFIFAGIIGVYFYFQFRLFHIAMLITIVISGLVWYDKPKE